MLLGTAVFIDLLPYLDYYRKNPYITQKINKNSDKDFLLKRCQRNRTKVNKASKSRRIFLLFEKFSILHVKVTSKKSLEYALNYS